MRYEHVVLGGTGHVGTALVHALLEEGHSVLVIGHDADKAEVPEQKGAQYQVANVLDSARLHELFSSGERVFILNPPAPPSGDTVKEETASVRSILAALKDVELRKIVAASTYGAQHGNDIGDLGVLFELEQGLATLGIPVAVIRSAYYMSNWAMAAKQVQEKGILPTLYPEHFKLPMVAPQDVGTFAAELMLNDTAGLHFIEAPERYTPANVAHAFALKFGKPVQVATTPVAQWSQSLQATGFSALSAQYMVNMTDMTINGDYEVAAPRYGSTDLQTYINSLP